MNRKMRLIPIKPVRPGLPAADEAKVRIVIGQLKDLPGALLPILHSVQNALGYVPKEAVELIATELNLSRAEVHGVVSFYHYFRSHKPGKHIIQLCRAEACQAMGAVALEAHVKRRLGVDFHQTTTDQTFTLEPVYCLGNCALVPSVMFDDELRGRMSPQRFDELIDQTRSEA